ncbi:MAG: tetratricopeptide repeat protein, partial [Kiloniellales bacterium]|nr:tetratricopeptide repeat protein [Kiloniellales bacterium]
MDRAIGKSFAKTAVGALGGWTGILAAAANEVIDHTIGDAGAGSSSPLAGAIDRVAADFQAFALSEGIEGSAGQAAIDSSRSILEVHCLSALDLVGLELDANEAAKRTIAKANVELDPALKARCTQIIAAVYASLLKVPERLPGLTAAYRQTVLSCLGQLSSLPDQVASAIRAGAGASILVDPAQVWAPNQYGPMALLRAQFRIVPFEAAREPLCQEIVDWCNRDVPIAVGLFTGPGGTGKTRLFMEMCTRLRVAGWHAGFYDPDAERHAGAIDTLLADSRDLFVVIDYAEARRVEVAILLRRAMASGSARNRRFALVSRSSGEWWHQLCLETGGIAELLAGPATWHKPVEPLGAKASERGGMLARAVSRFAEAQTIGLSDVPAYDHSSEAFTNALFIHMAALAATDGKQIEDAQALLDYVLGREQVFWDKGLTAAGLEGLTGEPVRQAMALVTLAGGAADALEARTLISRAPLLTDQKKTELAKTCQVLHGSSPPSRWLESVTPDLLGERHVARVLKGDDTVIGAAVAADAKADQIRHALTVLTRMAPREPNARAWLERALHYDLERLAEPAMAVAIETGDPIGQVLAKALVDQPNAQLAATLEAQMPHQTVALREAAAAATSIYYHGLKAVAVAVAEPKPDDVTQELARIATHLANRLSDLGRREEALTAAQEAVDIRRDLAQAQPDAFKPYLATSLNNLGTMLSHLGRREEALTAAQEAVNIRRDLAQVRPDAFKPDLAMSLNNLGTRLRDLGRREEALTAAQEAVDIRRDLAQARPDAFKPDLAASLNNLGNMLSALGRREEALTAAREASEIYRDLAQARPDAFKPDLATSLNNLGNMLSRLGRREEALTAAREASEIYRDLA